MKRKRVPIQIAVFCFVGDEAKNLLTTERKNPRAIGNDQRNIGKVCWICKQRVIGQWHAVSLIHLDRGVATAPTSFDS